MQKYLFWLIVLFTISGHSSAQQPISMDSIMAQIKNLSHKVDSLNNKSADTLKNKLILRTNVHNIPIYFDPHACRTCKYNDPDPINLKGRSKRSIASGFDSHSILSEYQYSIARVNATTTEGFMTNIVVFGVLRKDSLAHMSGHKDSTAKVSIVKDTSITVSIRRDSTIHIPAKKRVNLKVVLAKDTTIKTYTRTDSLFAKDTVVKVYTAKDTSFKLFYVEDSTIKISVVRDTVVKFYAKKDTVIQVQAPVMKDTVINICPIKDTLEFECNIPISVRNLHSECGPIKKAWKYSRQSVFDSIRNNSFIKVSDIFLIADEYGSSYLPTSSRFSLFRNKDSSSTLFPLPLSKLANQIFSASVYTDALALFGNYSNGLIQTEVSATFRLHSKTAGNTGLLFANYFKIKVVYRKFDTSSDTYYAPDSTSLNSRFDRMAFYQKSFLTPEFEISAFTYYFRSRHMKTEHLMYLDLGYSGDLIKTGIVSEPDGTHLDTISKNVFMHSPYVKLGCHFNFQHNVSFELNSFWYLQFFGNEHPSDLYATTQGDATIGKLGRYEGLLTYNPGGSPHSLFVRSSYTTNLAKNQLNDGFYQLQIGYSIDFGQLTSQMSSIVGK